MRETISNIENAYNLIMQTNNIKDALELNKFIGNESNENFNILLKFYNDFPSCLLYLYSDMKDTEKYEITNKLKYICKWIITHKNVFENSEYYDHIPNAILDPISNKEECHTFKMMFDGNVKDYYAEIEYMKFRQEIEEIILEEKEEDRTSSEKRYLYDHDKYYKYFFANGMNLLEKNFFTIPEDEIEKFLYNLEQSGYFNKIFEIEEDEVLNFEDHNLVFQYVRFVLKMKSIFKRQELLDDQLINAVFNGKIKNKKIIGLVFSNYDTKDIGKNQKKKVGNPFNYVEIFRELLKKDGLDEDHFYKNLVNHFKKVNMSDSNINKILMELIDSNDNYYDAIQYIIDEGLDEIQDYTDMIRNNDFDEKAYLTTNAYLFQILKQKEIGLLEDKTIAIPFDYAVKKLENLPDGVIETIQTLVDNGMYNEEECSTLKTKMKEKQIYNERTELMYEDAIELIRENIENNSEIDIDTLKTCLRSIIMKTARDANIELNNRIFFCNSERKNGSANHYENYIMLNNDLLHNFINQNKNINERMQLFSTIFHELKHLKQFDDMKKGNVDFLTYNFIKEEIIRDFDENFYRSNYFKFFIEEDARQFGIIDSMKFLNRIGIYNFDEIYANYKIELKKELNSSNISADSVKKIPFRNAEAINISDYIGKIIHLNPEVINMYDGILQIEYERDGSRKSLEQIINEFNELEDEEQENKFSVYYGIIHNLYDSIGKGNISPDVDTKIKEFFEKKKSLVSAMDIIRCMKKTDPIITDAILNSLEREIKGNETGEVKRTDKEKNSCDMEK